MTVYVIEAQPTLSTNLPQIIKAEYKPQNKENRYKRKKWKHWNDADKDCQNTRHEILIRDSLIPVTFASKKKCRVIKGKWLCPYVGKIYYNAREIDIDHVVPLKEAYRSGGHKWNKVQKKKFANDMHYTRHLLAVNAKSNRKKRDHDPARWLPKKNICSYIDSWIHIKNTYQLSIDNSEEKILKTWLNRCSKITVPHVHDK